MRPWLISRRLASAFLLAAALAGCQTTEPFRATAPVFEPPPVWTVAADRIETEIAPGADAVDPEAAVRLGASPLETALAWPMARLRPDPAARGRVVYRVEKATATRETLETTSGVAGAFRRDPEFRLSVAFAVSLASYGGDGSETGGATAQASASRTVREGANEEDRRKAWDAVLREAARELDEQLIRQTPTGLARAIQR